MVLEKTRKQWDVDTLLGKIETGILKIPPFQRGSVWNRVKKSEAIYSLLTVGLPDIILLEEKGEYHILDGLQRITSIKEFVYGSFSIKLDEHIGHIDPELAKILEGKSFSELPDELQRRLRNAELGAVIYSGVGGFEVAREIFTRLNYKPTPLSPQELLFVLSYESEKSELLRELGKEISRRRFKGFGLLARFLADYSMAEKILAEGKIREEWFKFKTYYDWLYGRLKEVFSQYDVKRLAELSGDFVEVYSILKREFKLDLMKKPYWCEAVAFFFKLSEREGISPPEFVAERGEELLKKLEKSEAWLKNISQRSRQKPKGLKERFEVLQRILLS